MAHKREEQWQRLAEGVYLDGSGIRATVQVGSGRTKRSDEARWQQGDRDLKEIVREAQAWRDRRRAELREGQPQRATGDTLRADVPRFLATMPQSPRRDDFENHLKPWLDAPVDPTTPKRGTLGDVLRSDLTREDVRVQCARWQEAGYAANTINHRVRVLRTLYRVLDDDEDAYNPAEKIAKLAQPTAEARGIPIDLVERIIDAIPNHGRAERGQPRPPINHTKIRLRVMVYTGLPHTQVKALTPHTVDLLGLRTNMHPPGPHLYAAARRKGRGTAKVWLPLLPPAVDALRDFAAANLWGDFSNSAMRKTWQKAIARVAKACKTQKERQTFLGAIPPDCRPYDCRHSFGTEALRLTGDLHTVGALLQHSAHSTAITQRYTLGAQSALLSAAVAKLSEHWGKPTPPPAASPMAPRLVRGGKT